jgi:hypothetical protein
VSTCQLCVVGNEAPRAALTPYAGLWKYRECEEVHAFSAAMYGPAQHRLSLIAQPVDVARLAAALVHPDIGVLGSDDQFPQTCSQVGLILSAMRLSRSREEGLWHAS